MSDWTEEHPAVLQMKQIAADRAAMWFIHLRPRLFIDGDAWCALYGEDLQSGVAGFGATPQAAAFDFERNFEQQRAAAAPPDPEVKP